jgi:hypothetical protein
MSRDCIGTHSPDAICPRCDDGNSKDLHAPAMGASVRTEPDSVEPRTLRTGWIDGRPMTEAEARVASAVFAEAAAGPTAGLLGLANDWLHSHPGIRMTAEDHADWYRFLREHGYEPNDHPLAARSAAAPSVELDARREADRWGVMADRLESLWDEHGSEEMQGLYFALDEARTFRDAWDARLATATPEEGEPA